MGMAQLAFYTIYKNPSDYPDKYVLRRSVNQPVDGVITNVPDPDIIIATDTLDEAREALPHKYLVNIGTMPGEDPTIAEVWI
jgi:hypothetical protein